VRLPWPIEALEGICEAIPDYQKILQKGLDLGLFEISPEVDEKDRSYRISRILSDIFVEIKLPENISKLSLLSRRAWETLTSLWGDKDNNEEKWNEIFRLKFGEIENPNRFREAFFQMLFVQIVCQTKYNADCALEAEMEKSTKQSASRRAKQFSESLTYSKLKLEEFLQKEEWRRADEETAWMIYQLMIFKGYQDFRSVFKSYLYFQKLKGIVSPWMKHSTDYLCFQNLKEIDLLWMKYSNGKFGFSVQSQIWQNEYEIWKDNKRVDLDEIVHLGFFKEVGWEEKHWDELLFSKELSPKGELPSLWAVREIRPTSTRYGNPMKSLYFSREKFELWHSIEDEPIQRAEIAFIQEFQSDS
jgi:hypothetical protein